MELNVQEWSEAVAELVADALLIGNVISGEQITRTTAIAAEEILARLIIGDHPKPTLLENWNFDVKEVSAGVYAALGRRSTGNTVSRTDSNEDTLIWEVIADAIRVEMDIRRGI